ncbi:MAG: S66 peptidase family protein, partial [Janthinobacterium sp.]
MSLIIPQPLKKGDTIGFISPSAGPNPRAIHRIHQAKKILEGLGYKVIYAKNSLKSEGYTSSSIDNRIEDIHEMFSNPEVKMVMCTIGGNNSNQLLKYIDFKLIKNNPKIFIGYSDITVLHYAIMTQANFATYCGPCAMTQFGEYPKILDYTLKYFDLALTEEKGKKNYAIEPSSSWTEEFLDWFQKKDQERPRNLENNKGYEWINMGKAEGNILGGTILSLNHLAGTKYWADPTGSIFFLDILQESGSLDEASIDSFLTDFDN